MLPFTSFSLRPTRYRQYIAAMLITCLALQGFLSFISAPSFVKAADGRYVLLCTLQGIKQVYVDRNSRINTPPPEQEARPGQLCPACVLHAQLGMAIPAVQLTLQAVLFTTLSILPIQDDDPIAFGPLTQTAIRAPPFTSQ